MFQLHEAFISASVAIVSSSLAVIFIGTCMLIVIYLCVKFCIDPDNVSAPLAAALGDLFVLLIMTLVVWTIESFFRSPVPAYFGMFCFIVFAFGPALSYLRENACENCLAADYITLLHSLAPLLSAALLSSASGWILASYVDHLPSLPRLQPPINGVGGNLASILISRMTTRLSITSNPTIVDDVIDKVNATTLLSWLHVFAEKERSPLSLGWDLPVAPPPSSDVSIGAVNSKSYVQIVEMEAAESSLIHSDSDEDETLERRRPLGNLRDTELALTRAISDSDTSACRLLVLCLPLHFLLLIINCIVSTLFHESLGPNAFSLSVIIAYIAAGFLQVFVLLSFARWLVLRRWLGLASHQQQHVDTNAIASAGGLAALDLTCIAVTTGLGDLVGTAFLAAFLHLAEG
ncbi:hypothetical protein Aperf_G00000033687 [Anoplocephala perfoliata]